MRADDQALSVRWNFKLLFLGEVSAAEQNGHPVIESPHKYNCMYYFHLLHGLIIVKQQN